MNLIPGISHCQVHSSDEVAGEHTSHSFDKHKAGRVRDTRPADFAQLVDPNPFRDQHGQLRGIDSIISQHQQDSNIQCPSLWVRRPSER